MTVIAWDGNSLAADKLNWFAGSTTTITKIRKIRGELYGISGKTALAQSCWKWIESEMSDDSFPGLQNDGEKSCIIMHIDSNRKIWIYEHGKNPWHNESPYYAIGGGGELAVGAMAMKANAKQAVEVAIQHNSLCGKGIDILTFD